MTQQVTQTVSGSGNVFTASGNIYIDQRVLSVANVADEYNLKQLLKRVRHDWIDGFLAESTSADGVLQLPLKSHGNLVEPDRVVAARLELPGHQPTSIPATTDICQVFAEVGGFLLILGDPGCGKTTTLLQLAGKLIERVEEEGVAQLPIPVVFNLSSWNTSRTVAAWIIDQLTSGYHVNKSISTPWLEQNRLLPLFDGLDEVSEELRSSCVHALNNFSLRHGAPGIAVCCRRIEYLQLPETGRLHLNGAVIIGTLSEEQVLGCVRHGSDGLARLLEHDRSLLEMAQNPLLLRLMASAYPTAAGEIAEITDESGQTSRRKRLFDAYIGHALTLLEARRGDFGKPAVLSGLRFLARGMLSQSSAVFVVEQLQPSWLPRSSPRICYFIGSRVACAFLYSLLCLGPSYTAGTAMIEVYICVACGLFAGVIDALFHLLDWDHRTRSTFLRYMIGVLVGASLILVGVLAGALVGDRYYGSGVGALFGLMFGTRILRGTDQDIATLDALQWSWRGVRRGVTWAILAFALPFGVCSAVSIASGTMGRLWSVYWQDWFAIFAIFTAAGATLGGLSGRKIEEHRTPNQGLKLTMRNSILKGVVVGCGVVGVLYAVDTNGGTQDLLRQAYIISVSSAFALGWMDIIQHAVLRAMLRKQIPVRLVGFLECAVGIRLLHRVGGGYVFLHRLLLEHFSQMEIMQTGDLNSR